MTQALGETFGPFSMSIDDILGWGDGSLGKNTYSASMRTQTQILGTHEDLSSNPRHPCKTKSGMAVSAPIASLLYRRRSIQEGPWGSPATGLFQFQ